MAKLSLTVNISLLNLNVHSSSTLCILQAKTFCLAVGPVITAASINKIVQLLDSLISTVA